MDLNKLGIEDVDTYGHGSKYRVLMANPNTESEDGKIKVYFRDIKQHLIQHINEAYGVVGCIAWLTDWDILDAMSLKEIASIIVQKEDFLRPDYGAKSNWKKDLRSRYDKINFSMWKTDIKGMGGISYARCGDDVEGIRCLGNYNKDKNPAFPRCHHKFLLTCKFEKSNNNPFTPTGVWTGSFNFTNNASNSLENAVYITDKNIVAAYYAEWINCLQRSEPLDWESS